MYVGVGSFWEVCFHFVVDEGEHFYVGLLLLLELGAEVAEFL